MKYQNFFFWFINIFSIDRLVKRFGPNNNMQAVGKNTFVYVCPKGDPSVNSEFQHYVNTPAKEFVDNKIMSGIMKPKNNSIEYVEVDFIISKYSVYF